MMGTEKLGQAVATDSGRLAILRQRLPQQCLPFGMVEELRRELERRGDADEATLQLRALVEDVHAETPLAELVDASADGAKLPQALHSRARLCHLQDLYMELVASNHAGDSLAAVALAYQERAQCMCAGVRVIMETARSSAITGAVSAWPAQEAFVTAPLLSQDARRHAAGQRLGVASNSTNWAPALGVAAAATAVAANRRQSRLSRRAVGERSEASRQPKTSRSAVTEKLVTSIDPSAGPQGTYQVGIDFKNWLQSAEEELEVDGLRVEGHVPAWLRGRPSTARDASVLCVRRLHRGFRLRVVAEFIERSQRNAGYLVSFNNLWKAPEDDSSSVPRILDLPLMGVVVLGVLVAAPVIFCVFYVVPVSLLIEAYWGGTLRHCFCIPPSTKRKCSVADLIQLSGAVSGYVIGCFVLALVVLAFIYKCTHLEGRRPTRRYLYWRSCVNLSSRWLVMLLLILATERRVPFILLFFLITVLFGLVALSFKALGWGGVLRVFLVVLLPLWFIWPTTFLLQWRIFGPVTHQPLFTPLFGTQIFGQYSDKAWNCFTGIFLTLAIVAMPGFNFFHRFVHIYFRVSLQRAFYCGGKDVPTPEVAKCPWSPILLFGATLNEYQRPQDDEPHCLFAHLLQSICFCSNSSHHSSVLLITIAHGIRVLVAACDGMRKDKVPSKPAVDDSVEVHDPELRGHCDLSVKVSMLLHDDKPKLTQINKWHTRILMAMLNLTQGDWLRFDMGQNWHSLSKRYPSLLEQPHLASLIDRLPEILTLSCIYLFCLLFNLNSSYSAGQNEVEACTPFWIFRFLAAAFIGVFIGGLSFFGHVRCFAWLLASPVIRQIHMFLMHHECMENPPMYLYLTDGGPVEDLGRVGPRQRRRRWILSFDVGDDPACEPYSHAAMGQSFSFGRSSDSTPTQKRAELGGICCECCHEWAHGGACGAFPNTHTVNQFFTPKAHSIEDQARLNCRLPSPSAGFALSCFWWPSHSPVITEEMAAPAIEALTKAQVREANARRNASRGSSW
eukprot:s1411_g5.t2